jgi:hypothetical protein
VLATTFRAQLERAKNKEANREKNEGQRKIIEGLAENGFEPLTFGL